MATAKTGDQLTTGDTFKDRGRWHTATGPSWVPDLGGRACASAREIPFRDTAGREDTMLVWADELYQLQGAKGTPFTTVTWPGLGKSVQVTTEIAYRKREYGGWNVHLAANGRLIGWVTPNHHDRDYNRVVGWSAHIAASAFRGSGPDDEGHVMDEVPAYLYGGTGSGGSGTIATGRNRDEAVSEMLYRLHEKHAPALGYGRHYAVKAYDDPTCPGYGQRWAVTDAGPACPACGLGPVALILKPPRRRGARYQGTVGFHLAAESAGRRS
jgi:hypothetical protein